MANRCGKRAHSGVSLGSKAKAGRGRLLTPPRICQPSPTHLALPAFPLYPCPPCHRRPIDLWPPRPHPTAPATGCKSRSRRPSTARTLAAPPAATQATQVAAAAPAQSEVRARGLMARGSARPGASEVEGLAGAAGGAEALLSTSLEMLMRWGWTTRLCPKGLGPQSNRSADVFAWLPTSLSFC